MVWQLNYRHDFRSSRQHRIQRMLLLLGTVIFDGSMTMRFIHDSQNHGKPTAIDSSEAGTQREPPCREWAVTLKLIWLKYIAEHVLTDWLIDDMTSVIQNFNVNQQSWYWQPLTAPKLTYFVSLCADMACCIDILHTNWTCSKTLVVYIVY